MESDKIQFHAMLAVPERVKAEEEKFLDTFASRFPFCQTLQFFRARAHQALGREDAAGKVALAAIYAPDRTVLFNFMNLAYTLEQEVPQAAVIPMAGYGQSQPAPAIDSQAEKAPAPIAFDEGDYVSHGHAGLAHEQAAPVSETQTQSDGIELDERLSGSSGQASFPQVTEIKLEAAAAENPFSAKELEHTRLDPNPVPAPELDSWAQEQLNQLHAPNPKEPEEVKTAQTSQVSEGGFTENPIEPANTLAEQDTASQADHTGNQLKETDHGQLEELLAEATVAQPDSTRPTTEDAQQPATVTNEPAGLVSSQSFEAAKHAGEQMPADELHLAAGFSGELQSAAKNEPEPEPQSGPLHETQVPVSRAHTPATEEIPVRKTFLYWLKKTQKGYFLNSDNAAPSNGTQVQAGPGTGNSLRGSAIRLDESEEIKKIHEVDSLEKTIQENIFHQTIADIGQHQQIEFDLSKKEDLIIERFLRENPQHIKPNQQAGASVGVEKQVEKASEEEGFYTETIAQILYQQKHFDKAIKAYQALSLKNPEKKAFFASLIDKIQQEADSNSIQ